MTITKKPTKKKLNVYAKTFRFIEYDKNRKHLSKLTNFLADNEWLKVSNDKYKDFTTDKKIFNNQEIINRMIGFKPGYVSWFSKGSWLFHDIGLNIDKELIYITVDYKNIYKIANKSPYSDLMSNDQYKSQLSKFNKKYIIPSNMTKTRLVRKEDKFSSCNWMSTQKECTNSNSSILRELNDNIKWKRVCKWNNKKNKCEFRRCSKKKDDCVPLYNAQFYNWAKLLKKYDGFAIYPMMNLKEMEEIQHHHGFDTWDVETLVLSNSTPITHHHNLGTIRELLNIPKKDSDKEINYSKLVSILIKKISEIRKSM